MPDSPAYHDYGGQLHVPASYAGVIHRACVNCKAEPNKLCTFQAEELINGVVQKVTKNRHHPCIARIKGDR